MAARRRHVGPIPHVRVPRRGPRVVSIQELKWNARLGVLTQLVYLAGRLPRQLRLVAGVAAFGALWAVLTAVILWWPYLLAAVLAWLLWRHGRPRWAAWRQYRRDRAEALEVLGDDEIPY